MRFPLSFFSPSCIDTRSVDFFFFFYLYTSWHCATFSYLNFSTGRVVPAFPHEYLMRPFVLHFTLKISGNIKTTVRHADSRKTREIKRFAILLWRVSWVSICQKGNRLKVPIGVFPLRHYRASLTLSRHRSKNTSPMPFRQLIDCVVVSFRCLLSPSS